MAILRPGAPSSVAAATVALLAMALVSARGISAAVTLDVVAEESHKSGVGGLRRGDDADTSSGRRQQQRSLALRRLDEDDFDFDCGCPATCTSEALGAIAGPPGQGSGGGGRRWQQTCGDRIVFLVEKMGYDETSACRTIGADEFPDYCGGCNPDTCGQAQAVNTPLQEALSAERTHRRRAAHLAAGEDLRRNVARATRSSLAADRARHEVAEEKTNRNVAKDRKEKKKKQKAEEVTANQGGPGGRGGGEGAAAERDKRILQRREEQSTQKKHRLLPKKTPAPVAAPPPGPPAPTNAPVEAPAPSPTPPTTGGSFFCSPGTYNDGQACSSDAECGGVCRNGPNGGLPCLTPSQCANKPCDSPIVGSCAPPPTEDPTSSPTRSPTDIPTVKPTDDPTGSPTVSPTGGPSGSPTSSPTSGPTSDPSSNPSASPSSSPMSSPTVGPTRVPTSFPTDSPTDAPTVTPTSSPTVGPSYGPTDRPSSSPSVTSRPTFEVPLVPKPPPGQSAQLPADGSDVTLERSGPGELITLSRVPPGGSGSGATPVPVPAGRSYDGRDWEAAPPLNFLFDCAAGGAAAGCITSLASGADADHYLLKTAPPPALTSEQEASRLLTQATFGPTTSTIAEAARMTPEDWISEQMSLPVTSHREHYRRRSNARLREDTALFGRSDPCLPGSRWNGYAFTELDVGKVLNSRGPLSNGNIALTIDGHDRTELDPAAFVVSDSSMGPVSPPYVICYVPEYVGGAIRIGSDGGGDTKCDEMNTGTMLHPPVQFFDSSFDDGRYADAYLRDLSPSVLDVKLLVSLSQQPCSFSPVGPLIVKAWSSSDYTGSTSYYVHDRRVQFIDNTPSSTSTKRIIQRGYERGAAGCPSAPKTFLNEETCRVESSCSAPMYGPADVILNDQGLRDFYEIEGIHAYVVDGLRMASDAPSPCRGTTSTTLHTYRFVQRNSGSGGCPGGGTNLDESIRSAVVNAIAGARAARHAAGARPLALDVEIAENSCSDSNRNAVGGSFTVGGGPDGDECWEHAHDDEWGVFNFNLWVMLHPGNPIRYGKGRPNPIADIAERESSSVADSVTLHFPAWKDMFFWEDNHWRFDVLGLYNDTVDFASLPAPLQGSDLASRVGAPDLGPSDGSYEVCGSPGEVANDPSAGHQYNAYARGDQGDVPERSLDQDHHSWTSKLHVWATVSAKAVDQLRQRIAHALSSVFVVTNNDVAIDLATEPWANYYDIFTRNAFGNFEDVLREVAFSPMMGIMLTYEHSRSMAYSVEETGSRLYPDENFAREIMQLFTIGLWKLHRNGTRVLDANGDPVPTYDNEDIVTFARGWTGFERNEPRPNLEADWDTEYWSTNVIDPMFLPTKDRRDVFPKLGLEDGGRRPYIGDKVQRCDDLPPRAFLKKGAKYRLLGWDGTPQLGRADPDWWRDHLDSSWPPRLTPDESNSALFAALCDADPADPTGSCRFKSQVVLEDTLPCHGSCTAQSWGNYGPCECDVDEPRAVRLNPSARTGSPLPVYYEYVREPCVTMAFPEDGNLRAVGETYGGNDGVLCADARLPVASGACCDANGDAVNVCVFQGERVTYATAEERCQALGKNTCAWSSVPTNWDCGTDLAPWEWYNPKAGLQFTWTNSPCTVQAQVDKEGNVAIIHNAAPLSKPVKGRVAVNTGTYFRAIWDNGGMYPKAVDGCSGATSTCYVEGSTCVCETSTAISSVFDGTFFPSREELDELLHIGAPEPDAAAYSVCQAQLCLDAQDYVVVRTPSPIATNAELAFDESTIFELNPGTGKSVFLFNRASTVDVGGGFTFRNPPMFNSAVDQTPRDALYETDAILRHYFEHSNVAPFISTRLIQFLVTSNPSPRYVQAVADAFASGVYASGSSTFGGGEYGDLSAAVAAVLLDSEARSPTLDADGAHGKAREPLLKVLHLLRSMELSSSEEREVLAAYWRDRIGQEAHNAPSVFGFYLPEFQPSGPVSDRGLVAPETQLFDAPKLVGYMNAVSSLPMFGFSDCEWWSGLGLHHSRYNLLDHPEAGEFSCAVAADLDPATPGVPQRLGWRPVGWGGESNVNDAPASVVIEEMDLLLTGGRLDSNSRSIIEQAYSGAAAGGTAADDTLALRIAQKLFAMTPEFHVTNRLQDGDSDPPPVRNATEETLPSQPNATTGYKAVVYLYLAGACDSYSMLVPHSQCAAPSDLNAQYHSVRADVAVDQGSLRPINVPQGTQPCDVFGLHPSLSHLQQLYNDGDAAFVANIGPLVEPVIDRAEFEDKTKEVPPALFAHNTQTKVTQTVFAQDSAAGGVLGRIGDALNAQASEEAGGTGEKVEIFDAYSISGTPKILEGDAGISRSADVLSGSGVAGLYYPADDHEAEIRGLNARVATSIFGETYSDKVTSTLNRIDTLGGALGSSSLATPYDGTCEDTYLDNQFKQVARIIASRDVLEAKRDVFFVQHWGYDTHSDNGPALTSLLGEVDDALYCFSEEMKAQGIWSNVTVVSASEFGRTLTSNGLGTDHAWGGNHFVAGGAVDGGKILGQFPNDLTENGPLNIGRGRIIPTTSWEHLWHALADWFGVASSRMPDVLPNMANFQGLFTAADVFK